ncbi:MAG TPA: XdhC family protein [Actinomycetota bacterium]|nr:XdhC family protein [Actinomycetota bacterium]
MRQDVLELAARLSAEGTPFVLATVVWSRAPSSGKPSSTALVTADGTLRGWLGGACAEPVVLRESLRALEEGMPRLLFLGTPDELEGNRRDGVVTVPIACQSEGALEVYVEPVLPSPHLVVIGRSPAVDALAGMATTLGWRAVVVDDGGDPALHPGVADVRTGLDLVEADVGPGSFVVVATQGHYDEDALERALRTPAGYVGLVASRRRAEGVLGYLRDRGVPERDLARVHAPAGLDLGRLPNQEIAVAILAELVQLRAAGELGAAGPQAEVERHEEIDPVCHMVVEVSTARYRTAHEGRTYHFCSAGCLERFSADPAAYLTAPAP